MANELPYTVDAYNTLCAAIAQGAARVKYEGKEIDFRSLNDMLRIKGLMEAVLFPSKKKATRKFLNFKKGFN
jgi:hypothetical protein